MSDRVSVRVAVEGDARAITAFNLRLAKESEGRVLDPERVERGVRSILAGSACGRYWIAEQGGAPCGQCLVTIEPSDWGAGSYWWLQSVYVDPDHRGAGVFRALWDEIAARADAAGDVLSIRLYVERSNAAARAVYERLGMEPTGYLVYERAIPAP